MEHVTAHAESLLRSILEPQNTARQNRFPEKLQVFPSKSPQISGIEFILQEVKLAVLCSQWVWSTCLEGGSCRMDRAAQSQSVE